MSSPSRRAHPEEDLRTDEVMKLTTNQQVSGDGVVENNGRWARSQFDSDAMSWNDQAYQRADAFLFGRRTYDLFAGYWGVRGDLENPIVRALNTKPKYVASNTLTDPQWTGTTLLSGELATAIQELDRKSTRLNSSHRCISY